MSDRLGVWSTILTLVMATVWSAPAFLAAQARAAASTITPAKKTTTWTPSPTPDGQPDLQGYWSSQSYTPLERPVQYGNREFYTDQEMAEVFSQGVQRAYEFTYGKPAETPEYDPTVYALGSWQNGIKPNRRTSFIVDPQDGRIPALTPEGERVRAAMKTPLPDDPEKAVGVHFDGPEDIALGTRCLTFGGPPILPAGYNSNVRIVQSAGYVMIEYEWNSEVRIIPLDGRPHLSENIHRWHGDSRGQWEGKTLVVETTNFRPGATFRGANPKTLKITERFTRLEASTIEYKFTIDDPTTWTKPWTAIVPLNQIEGPMFEYACSEGNNGLVNMLAGSRAADKAEAERAAATDPK
jgi:hypothetical protein